MKIQIKTLKSEELYDKSLEKGHLYKDIKFDLEPSIAFNSQLNRQEVLKDVAAIYDEEAVKNSIRTAFLTSPGQKILNPTYGIDLSQYLFEPVSFFLADIIEDRIKEELPIHEPRVELENVRVEGDPDNNIYYINLQINIPSLNTYGISVKSELNTSGYSIV
jgi:phage baseplate assembly protein W